MIHRCECGAEFRWPLDLAEHRVRAGHSARCGCGHLEDLHHPAGVCAVELPPFEEEELPAWRCPCRQFTAAAGMWRWHQRTQTWQAVPLPRAPAPAAATVRR